MKNILKNLTKKKIITIIFALIIIIAGTIFVIEKNQYDIPLTEDTGPRVDEIDESWEGNLPTKPIPNPGEGIAGTENPEFVVDDTFYTEIDLPFIHEPGISPGSGFIFTSEGFKKDDIITAVAYPRDSSADSPEAIELETIENRGKRQVRWNVVMPTNISEGEYTMEVSGGDEMYEMNFKVIPFGSQH